MTVYITSLHAVEILDSRARPTLSVTLALNDGTVARAGVPAGASTGSREALELRDGGERYSGQGVRRAVDGVNGEIAGALVGTADGTFPDVTLEALAGLDAMLGALDGTTTKARLGANAVLGVSMAAARAFAASARRPLWRLLNAQDRAPRLPVPHFNLVNGGAHAANALDFQEFMIAPLGAPSLQDAVQAGAEVYAALRRRLTARGDSTGLGDEGGFAPAITEPEEVCELLVAAIGDAGYTAGRDGIALALDPAASEFYRDGLYRVAGEALNSAGMIERYAEMVDRFPIWSIEDGLAEDDWGGWTALTERLGDRLQLVGDDIFVTDPATISAAIAAGVGNAALIKPNQIGTVTETLAAMRVCREAGYAQMVSHRSGETEDTFIADLAVGSGCGQIKAGAPARGERVAKYNRLLEIGDEQVLSYAGTGQMTVPT